MLCASCQFVKIDAEKSPFLVERLAIVMLPSILCIKDGKTVHTIVGFDELGVSKQPPFFLLSWRGRPLTHCRRLSLLCSCCCPLLQGQDEFPKETLAYVLAQHKVLKYDGPPPEDVDEDTGAVQPKGLNSIDMRRGKTAIREGGAEAREGGDSDDDEMDAYLEGYEEPTADES